MKIEGCAAIVTGGGTGLGAAAASALAERGARVALLGRRMDIVKDKAEEIGGLGIACDISSRDQVDAALAEAEQAHGPARILINSAADTRLATLLLQDGSPFPFAEIENIIQTTLLGTMYVTQHFAARLTSLPPLEDGERGVVVDVSSSAGTDGAVGVAYTAAKAGVNALALSLAREFAGWGIRVMTIAPGGSDTELFRNNATAEISEKIASGFVFPQRLGRPQEFGALVAHVCENSFLNGSLIRFDGAVRRNDILPILDPQTLTRHPGPDEV